MVVKQLKELERDRALKKARQPRAFEVITDSKKMIADSRKEIR